MGDFLSRSRTLTRFRIESEVTDAELGIVPAKLRQFAFASIDNSSEERSFGWANFDDMLDTRWEKSPPEKGEYIVFSLRLDTRRIPPAVLKRAFQEALDKEESQNKEHGRKFISRERRAEIKEQVKLKLMAKAMPIPACFQAVWSLRDNTVLLCSTNEKIINMFAEHFQRSFDLRLMESSPADMAESITSVDEVFQIIETSFVGGETPTLGGADIILGQEYLLWMWYRSANGASFTGKDVEPFTVNMGNKVVVEGGEREVVACAGALYAPTESMNGLASGKHVSRGSIVFSRDELEFAVTLKASELAFGPLKTPAVAKSDDDDPDATFLENVYLVEAAYAMFDVSFAQFVKLRIGPDWAGAVSEIGQWIRDSAKKGKSLGRQISPDEGC